MGYYYEQPVSPAFHQRQQMNIAQIQISHSPTRSRATIQAPIFQTMYRLLALSARRRIHPEQVLRQLPLR